MADAGEFFPEVAEDVTMGGEEVAVEIEALAATEEEAGEGSALEEAMETIENAPARVTFIDYLKSPVVSLLVGQGDEQAQLTAHQALLVASPWFAESCSKFTDDISVNACNWITRLIAD